MGYFQICCPQIFETSWQFGISQDFSVHLFYESFNFSFTFVAPTTFSKDGGVMKSVSKGILISGSRTSSLSPVSVLELGFGSKHTFLWCTCCLFYMVYLRPPHSLVGV